MKTINKYVYLFLTLFTVFSIVSCNECERQNIKTLTGKTIDKSDFDVFIKEQMDSFNIKGISIAIINEGKVVYHNTEGVTDIKTLKKVNKETIFEAASVSKPVFAWFVMKQVEKGLIDLDTPLYKYLPYPDIEKDDRYKQITGRMVLCHTSGFPNHRWFNTDHKLDIKFTPGEKFLYSGEGYLYLSKVVAHVNGLDLSNLDSLFQKEVADPLKLRHAYFQMNNYIKNNLASGHKGDSIVYDQYWDRNMFSALGGMHTEALSCAKFIIAVMENSDLKTESYDEMLKEHIKLPEYNELREALGVSSWSLGFAMSPSSKGIIYSHGGNNLGYTSGFKFNKELKYGYVFFTNSDQRNDLHKKIDNLLLN